jgi:hypothetical protein
MAVILKFNMYYPGDGGIRFLRKADMYLANFVHFE